MLIKIYTHLLFNNSTFPSKTLTTLSVICLIPFPSLTSPSLQHYLVIIQPNHPHPYTPTNLSILSKQQLKHQQCKNIQLNLPNFIQISSSFIEVWERVIIVDGFNMEFELVMMLWKW